MKSLDRRAGRIAVIAGMPRTATTFLYHTLQRHPSVVVPFRKELEFFSLEYDRGIPWYLDHFEALDGEKVGLDISPRYFWAEEVPPRLKSMNPEVRVALGVRDPVEMALSLYAQQSGQRFNMPPFPEFLTEFRVGRGHRTIMVRLKDSAISSRLEHFRTTFGKNLLLYSFDLVKEDPLRVIRTLERFLDLPRHFSEENFENLVINAASRRNSRLVSWALSHEPLIRAIRWAFPADLVRRVRGRLDRAAGRERYIPLEYRSEDMAQAQEALREDCQYVSRLVERNPIQLGNGDPFGNG